MAITENDAMNYSVMILISLKWLHSKGIVWANFSPKNILVGQNKIPKINYHSLINVDLFRKKTTTRSRFLSDQQFSGYCAPEVLRGEPMTEKSDMWALGVLLYQALS